MPDSTRRIASARSSERNSAEMDQQGGPRCRSRRSGAGLDDRPARSDAVRTTVCRGELHQASTHGSTEAMRAFGPPLALKPVDHSSREVLAGGHPIAAEWTALLESQDDNLPGERLDRHTSSHVAPRLTELCMSEVADSSLDEDRVNPPIWIQSGEQRARCDQPTFELGHGLGRAGEGRGERRIFDVPTFIAEGQAQGNEPITASFVN